MTQQATAPQTDDADDADEEYVMPCAEALMAGTLALMTGHARCGCDQHRDMMARKAVMNLHTLSAHPSISQGLRAVAKKVREQWLELIQSGQVQAMNAETTAAPPITSTDSLRGPQHRNTLSSAEQSRALWHTTPKVMQ